MNKQYKWCVQNKNREVNHVFIVAIFLFLFCTQGFALLTVNANYNVSPLKVTLSWNSQGSNNNVQIYRRLMGQEEEASWILQSTIADPVTSYADNTIVNGTTYEYKLINPVVKNNAAYISVGVNAPAKESRGTILLVVDNTISAPLSSELLRLEQDLIGDGWKVIRYNSMRHGSGTPADLKTWIKTQYTSNPYEIKALLLFGHLPVCMSGFSAPDGHESRPLPTDLFYADMDGAWTDALTYSSTQGYSNVPNDGIYDQIYLPGNSRIEIQVSRVDLSGMTAFKTSEVELYRYYLNKNHNWRHGITKASLKGIAGNSYMPMETSCVHSLFGSSNVVNGTFANSNNTAFTWAVDFGDPVGANYPNYIYKSIFVINFGSHKQKFEQDNNQMRAILCLPDYGLTCAWGSRPFWFFHHMGMGETIGYSAFRTQNNRQSDYTPACSYTFQGAIWNNLMGDPTLRMHIVEPPTNIKASVNSSNVDISWAASSDANIGYNVYSSTSETGTFSKLTSIPITDTTFSTPTSISATTYMVRAVKLEQVASGSYYNLSQGVFIENPAKATVDLTPPTVPTKLKIKNTTGGLTLWWDESTDNIKIGLYEIYKDGLLIGTSITNQFKISDLLPNTNYSFTVKAKDIAGNTSGLSTVLIFSIDSQAPTTPKNLIASAITSKGFILNWTASTDNIAVTEYEIFINGIYLKSTKSSTDTESPPTTVEIISSEIVGLNDNTTFTITIKAKDSSNNYSQPSDALNAIFDSSPPIAPTSLSTSAITTSGFTVTWLASTDNVAVIKYEIYLNDELFKVINKPNFSDLPTTTSFSDLNPATEYKVGVAAKDGVGNTSAISTISITTLSISGIRDVNIGGLNIYPNPISDKLNIELNTLGLAEISIFDIIGHNTLNYQIFTNPNGKMCLDVSNLKSGIYFIELKNNDKQFKGRFLKK